MIQSLLQDETGFIISAELILVATLLVLGMIVGLSEVQHAVTQELNDVGDAVGTLNQSFCYSGFSARKYDSSTNAVKAATRGSIFYGSQDTCDSHQCSISCDQPVYKRPKSSWSGCSPIVEETCSPACAQPNSLGIHRISPPVTHRVRG
jgi:Flp pilus assembly pilin Flp